jgi:N-acetylglutamate synthase
MRGKYRIRVGPADVGRRVSVRSRIPAGEGEPSTSDTLGYLRSWADGVLAIERRDGTTARIAEADLVAARVVGDPPQRRSRRYTS